VTTRRPDLDEAGMTLLGTATDIDAYKLEGSLNLPILGNVLALRLAGVIDESQGSRVRSIWREASPEFVSEPYRETRSYRVSLRFEPTDWITANGMYQKLRTFSRNYEQVVSESLINPAAAATGTIISAFDRRGIQEQGNVFRQNQEVFVGNLDIRFAGQRLSYVGSYNKQDFGILAGQDNGNFFTPPRAGIEQRAPRDIAGFDPVCQTETQRQRINLSTGEYNQCTHSIGKRESHELRLASDQRIAGTFDYVIGAFYDHNDNPSNITQETPLLLPPSSAIPARIQTINLTSILRRGSSTEKSVFGNLTAHLLGDRLELAGGLRYINYENENALFQSASQGTVQCAELTNTAQRCNTPTRDAQKTNATIYLASAKYRFTPDLMVYALTGSSWRPGPRAVGNFSFGPNLGGQTARELAFQNLPPERSKSYEIGVKASFAGGRGRFNLSAYHQTFQDYPFVGPQVFYLSTGNTGAVTVATANNPGGFGFLSPVNVEVNGVEGELSYQLLELWSLGVNAAYADGRIKNGTIACTDLNGDGVPDVNVARPTVAQLQAAVGAGQTLSQCSGINRRSTTAPKFSANLQSEYGFDLGARTDGFVRGLYSFYGKTASNPDNPFDDVGAYGLLNLFAGVRDKDGLWEITAFAKNVLNERRILSVANSTVTTSYQVLQLVGGRPVGAAGENSLSSYRAVTVTAPREFGINARIALGSR
jgi:iron complex outermembrane recepter protein